MIPYWCYSYQPLQSFHVLHPDNKNQRILHSPLDAALSMCRFGIQLYNAAVVTSTCELIDKLQHPEVQVYSNTFHNILAVDTWKVWKHL